MKDKPKKESSDGALDRGLNVLEMLTAEDRDAVSFTEITQRLGASKPTVSRLLQILCRRGYVDKSEQDGLYRYGLRMASFGLGVPLVDRLRESARTILDSLREETSATSILLFFDGSLIQTLAKSVHPAGPALREVGGASPLDGRSPWDAALLELYSVAERKALLAPIPKVREFQRQVKLFTRVDNVALDDGLIWPHLRRLGVARRDPSGTGAFLLGLGASILVLDDDKLSQTATQLTEAADTLAQQVGW